MKNKPVYKAHTVHVVSFVWLLTIFAVMADRDSVRCWLFHKRGLTVLTVTTVNGGQQELEDAILL